MENKNSNNKYKKLLILFVTWFVFIIFIIIGIDIGNQYDNYTIMLLFWAIGFAVLAIGLYKCNNFNYVLLASFGSGIVAMQCKIHLETNYTILLVSLFLLLFIIFTILSSLKTPTEQEIQSKYRKDVLDQLNKITQTMAESKQTDNNSNYEKNKDINKLD